MYAVVESGGKQYRVAEGDSLVVDRLEAEAGDEIALRPVMFRGDDVIADTSGLEKVQVRARVAEHIRGPKLKIFKYKAKKGYRRRAGHRSELTRLEVTAVSGDGKKKAPAKKAKAEGTAETKPATAKKAKAEGTAVKKAPAKKAKAEGATAKKPAAAKKSKAGGSAKKAAAPKKADSAGGSKKTKTEKGKSDGS